MARTHTHIHTYTHTYIHTYIHTHTHTHTHTHSVMYLSPPPVVLSCEQAQDHTWAAPFDGHQFYSRLHKAEVSRILGAVVQESRALKS